MWKPPSNDLYAEELYLAGERVSAGTYQQVGSTRQISLDHEDLLPASLDGHVACYYRVHRTWADVAVDAMPGARAVVGPEAPCRASAPPLRRAG